MGRETVSNPTNWLDIRLNWLTGYIRRRSDHKRSKSHTHSHKIRIDATWEHRMCVCSICRKSNVMHSRWLLFYLNKKKREEKNEKWANRRNTTATVSNGCNLIASGLISCDARECRNRHSSVWPPPPLLLLLRLLLLLSGVSVDLQ